VEKPDCNIERTFWDRAQIVAGVDEAGRGCIAGPVVAAAVILKDDKLESIGIDDSKKLKEKDRERFYDMIIEGALCWSVGIIDNFRIDEINILNTTYEAMHSAINSLRVKPDHILIDGNRFKSNEKNYTTIIKGDSKVLSIAAASVIAKVTRDRIMKEFAHIEFPDYAFDKHKGYGTRLHYEMIEQHGICRLHRLTFLKNVLNKEETLF
jgi:ribonuclease HII